VRHDRSLCRSGQSAETRTVRPQKISRKIRTWTNPEGYPGTVILELKPHVEANLAALARAKGLPLDLFLRGLLEQFAAPASGGEMTPAQKAAAFEQWAESFPERPVLSEEAMSRDAIYHRNDGSPR